MIIIIIVRVVKNTVRLQLVHWIVDLQCPNNAGGIAALNSHCKPLTQGRCWPWFVADFWKPASNLWDQFHGMLTPSYSSVVYTYRVNEFVWKKAVGRITKKDTPSWEPASCPAVMGHGRSTRNETKRILQQFKHNFLSSYSQSIVYFLSSNFLSLNPSKTEFLIFGLLQ